MRLAKPDELMAQAFPVLTAHISESELSNWFPVPFHNILDPEEAAEPSKAALIRLEGGEYFVLYYGELSKQLMVRIPTATNASSFLGSFFREVPLPTGRIIWRRHDAQLPRHIAANRVAAPRRRVPRQAAGPHSKKS